MYRILTAKIYFPVLLLLLCLTDLVILLNLSFLKPIFGFLYFTIIPGMVILHLLKLDRIEFAKKFVLSIGLSVSFLMFGGLFLNSFYPYISKPLSLLPLLITFNILLIILTFAAYKINKENFNIKDVFNLKLGSTDKLTSPLIFPILFPFMAVFGTCLMNAQANNIILLIMLFLIPTYVVAVVVLRNKIPKSAYPIAILMISISLLLSKSLRGAHIDAQDINLEFLFFQQVVIDSHWNITSFPHGYNACLSVGILPVIYHLLMGINSEYVYKLIFVLLFSITPVALYILFKRYMDELYAFISCSFIMATCFFNQFIVLFPRQQIALLFFALAMMILFDDELDGMVKKAVFILFIISLTISHYTSTYIFFVVISLTWITIQILKEIKIQFKYNITIKTIILFFVFIFFWYSQITETPFTEVIRVFKQIFSNLFILDMKGQPDLGLLFGRGLDNTPNIIFVASHHILNIIIGIGCLELLKNYKKTFFEKEYIIIIFIFLMILVSMVAIPFLSIQYGIDRLYLQMLMVLAPTIIIGSKILSKYLHTSFYFFISIILILQFICGTFLIFQLFGDPYSVVLNSEGYNYDTSIIFDQEVTAAMWFGKYYNPNLPIYTDSRGLKRLIGHGHLVDKYMEFYIWDQTSIFGENKTIEKGYIYLRYQNTVKNEIVAKETGIAFHYGIRNIAEYSHMLTDVIYTNGGSEVYILE